MKQYPMHKAQNNDSYIGSYSDDYEAKYEYDVTISARPVVTIYPKSLDNRSDVNVEVYL